MEKIRNYPKIYHLDNFEENTRTEFPKNELLFIQEKLDGSNITLEIEVDKIKIYSRNGEIDRENSKDWKKLIEWVDNNEELKRFQKLLAEELFLVKDNFSGEKYSYKLFGEWLSIGKLAYNQSYKNTFWLFDIKDPYGNFLSPIKVKEIAEIFKLNSVPMFEEKITIKQLIERIDEFVNGDTFLENSKSKREGIVVKTEDGNFRLKFVSQQFKEIKKEKREKSKPSIEINDELFTEQRIDKYVNRLKEDGKLPFDASFNGQNLKVLYENLAILHEDFMEEEFNNLLKLIVKEIKRNSGKALTEYIKKQNEKSLEEYNV